MHALGNTLLVMVAIFVIIQVPFLILTLWAARWEKHARSVYVPVDESEALPSDAYMDLTNSMVEDHDFEYLGVCHSGNGKLYKVRHDTWVSPDRRVFAVVGSGKISVIPHRSTWLTSKLIDGRVFITVDNPSGMAGDLSGMTEWKVVANADFHELLAKHEARLEAEITPVEPYSKDHPLQDHIELIAERAERMARMGYVYFLDEDRERWRYTTWGSLVRTFDTYRRQYVQLARNYNRRTLARPGDYGYVPSHQGRTRTWLRLVEVACWVTILVSLRAVDEGAPMRPRQTLFRLAVIVCAFLGLFAIWIRRWWISRGTVDPRRRRRRRYALALGPCLLLGGCYMIRPYREPQDTVSNCEVLIGGGKVFVAVFDAHVDVYTNHLSRLLHWWTPKPQFRPVASWDHKIYLFECDGKSVRRTALPEDSTLGQLMPVGQDLYLEGLGAEWGIGVWRDGQFVPVPPADEEKLRKDFAEDLESQCKAQGWEYAILLPVRANRLTKTIPLGGRNVLVDLVLDARKADSTQVLHLKIEVPGSPPHVENFPTSRRKGV